MATPNYQMLYQMNPGLFSNNESLADALYGTGGPSGNTDTSVFRAMQAAGGPVEAARAMQDPSSFFPQATQFFTSMAQPQQGQGGVPAQQPQQFVAPRAPVMDPNNIPAPIFRYK